MYSHGRAGKNTGRDEGQDTHGDTELASCPQQIDFDTIFIYRQKTNIKSLMKTASLSRRSSTVCRCEKMQKWLSLHIYSHLLRLFLVFLNCRSNIWIGFLFKTLIFEYQLSDRS